MPLPSPLVDAVLRRLGHWERPPATRAGLDALYLAWCRGVPFDNVRKLIALFSSSAGELPGMQPAEFFQAWLDHGVGATCWPTSNALAALLEACGFAVVRATGSMLDLGPPNHGTPLVDLDGERLLVDPAMLTERPIPLAPGLYDDLLPVEVERDARGLRVWFPSGAHPELMPCRLLEEGVDEARYAERYEASRAAGPFNGALYFRRNLPDRVVVLRGARKHVLDVTGVNTWPLDAAELKKTLTRFGVSQETLAAFEACGALQATLESEPPPAREFPERPPSKR